MAGHVDALHGGARLRRLGDEFQQSRAERMAAASPWPARLCERPAVGNQPVTSNARACCQLARGMGRLSFRPPAPPKALVLISPVPADGVLPLLLSLLARDPLSALKMAGTAVYPPVSRLIGPPVGIYSANVDRARAAQSTRQLRAESWRALAEACVPWPLTDPSLSVPTLVIGFTGDAFVPAEQVRRTARQLGADLQIHQGFSHAFTVEHDWERVAHDMAAWIRRIPGIRLPPRSPKRRSGRRLAAHRPPPSS